MPILVHVKNFQSIRDVQLKISGLTVITGTNNAGKSALLRAVYSACINARGTHFVRKGAKYSSVKLAFVKRDGTPEGEFVWEKGAKDNRYIVNGLVIDKVSHGAPKEVQDFGIRAIQAGNINLWPQVAHQTDGVVFLFGQSGAVMAEAVADVERVGILTKALRISESEHREVQDHLKIRRADLADVTRRRSRLDGLGAIEATFKTLQERQEAQESLAKNLKDLEVLCERISSTQKALDPLNRVSMIQVPSTSKVEEIQKRARRLKVLQQILIQWTQLRQYTDQWDRVGGGLDSLRAFKIDGALVGLKSQESVLSGLVVEKRKMDTAASSLRQLEAEHLRMDEELKGVRDRLDAVCPTCLRPLEVP